MLTTELICELDGVRGGDPGFPVQLCRYADTGRVVVRALNEDGFNCTDVDLLDLFEWFKRLETASIDLVAIDRALGRLGLRAERA